MSDIHTLGIISIFSQLDQGPLMPIFDVTEVLKHMKGEETCKDKEIKLPRKCGSIVLNVIFLFLATERG